MAWDAPLSRVLSPQGDRLLTLRDAGTYLSERFAKVARDAVLEHAIALLMKGAESGELADRLRSMWYRTVPLDRYPPVACLGSRFGNAPARGLRTRSASGAPSRV